MFQRTHIVDLIERATDTRPYCACGRHTTPVWRDGTVWLECSSLAEPRRGFLARLLAQAAPAHVRLPIVEAPAPTPYSAAAAA